jgi:hypothetical protein
MKQIRPNIWQVSYEEMGRPVEKGFVMVAELGRVNLDAADARYIQDHLANGYEPVFFVSQSAALGGQYVVVSRQRAA